jgi:hypothetical protein
MSACDDGVVDGEQKQQYSPATMRVERAAKREHNRILGLKTREELAMLLQSENPPKEKIEELQKTIQSKERTAYHALPENFVESLRERVGNLQNSPQLTGKITFIVAERQADPLLARRLLHVESDVNMSKDSDFAAYAAYAGDKCLCIHDFRYSSRREG